MATATRTRRPAKPARRRTFNDSHWRTAYGTRDYVITGMEYDDYAPAYRLGVQMSDRHGGRTFAEVEPNLADQWLAVQGKSRLSWQQARPAVKDGYAGVVIRSERPPTPRRKAAKGPKRAAAGSARLRTKATAAKDNRSKRRPQDAARINVNQSWEVDYWCDKLGTTPARLRQAVKKVGVMAKDVRRHLAKSKVRMERG
jgi:Protein of unknown function (DUF3606)